MIGRPGLVDDPRFTTNGRRMRHYNDFKPIVEGALRARPRDEWMELLLAEQVPCGPVNDGLFQALADPRFRHQQMVLRTADGFGGGSTFLAEEHTPERQESQRQVAKATVTGFLSFFFTAAACLMQKNTSS